MTAIETRRSHRIQLLAYLQLVRIPNVFTAISNVVMGFLFVSHSLEPLPGFFLLLSASTCLYWAGMVLNDVNDVSIDRLERPSRPIPSGAVSLRVATRMGYSLLALGIALGWFAGMAYGNAGEWRSGIIATLLAGCVWIYDGFAKRTIFGAVVMGSCRVFNVLLGMSLYPPMGAPVFFRFSASQWCVAGGIGLFIAGVTWFARTEARASSRPLLVWGIAVMSAGIGLLSAFPRFGVATTFGHEAIWPVVILALMLPVIRRATTAVLYPSPQHVQATIKLCIFSLILLDAAVCLAVRGPYYGLAVLSLLVPTVLLGRRFRTT